MGKKDFDIEILKLSIEIYKEAFAQADKVQSRIMSIRKLIFSSALILPIIGLVKDFISLNTSKNETTSMTIPFHFFSHTISVPFTLFFTFLAIIIILLVKYLELGVYHVQLIGIVQFICTMEEEISKDNKYQGLIGFKNGLGINKYICYHSRLSENIINSCKIVKSSHLNKKEIENKYSIFREKFFRLNCFKKILFFILDLILIPINNSTNGVFSSDFNTAEHKIRQTYNSLVFWLIILSVVMTYIMNSKSTH